MNRHLAALVLAAAVAGCGGGGLGSGGDAGVPADLSGTPDLTQTAVVDMATTGNASDGGPAVAACTPSTGSTLKFVISDITLPQIRTDFAYDLNGDGKPDNQYGNIEAIFATENLSALDHDDLLATITGGANLTLIAETSSDPSFQSDSCAAANVYAATSEATPRLDGTGTFTIDTNVPVAPFAGPITSGMLSSLSPATTTAPIALTVQLVVAGVIIRLPLVGAHISWTVAAPGRLAGQLNGAVRNSDVQGIMVPAMAASLTTAVAQEPTTAMDQQIASIFDNGGTPNTSGGACSASCQNPDGTCAVAGDHKIDVCEVSSNNLIKQVLAPDVQMFEADGTTYRPYPGRYPPAAPAGTKDCMSVGFGFTAVAATF